MLSLVTPLLTPSKGYLENPGKWAKEYADEALEKQNFTGKQRTIYRIAATACSFAQVIASAVAIPLYTLTTLFLSLKLLVQGQIQEVSEQRREHAFLIGRHVVVLLVFPFFSTLLFVKIFQDLPANIHAWDSVSVRGC